VDAETALDKASEIPATTTPKVVQRLILKLVMLTSIGVVVWDSQVIDHLTIENLQKARY
jgi:hypothetical protein